jgi:hypothetical protein
MAVLRLFIVFSGVTRETDADADADRVHRRIGLRARSDGGKSVAMATRDCFAFISHNRFQTCSKNSYGTQAGFATGFCLDFGSWISSVFVEIRYMTFGTFISVSTTFGVDNDSIGSGKWSVPPSQVGTVVQVGTIRYWYAGETACFPLSHRSYLATLRLCPPDLCVTANNKMTKYYEYDWDDLPEEAMQAAKVLGYSKRLWDDDEDTDISEKNWGDLNAVEQAAAETLGYTRASWNE